MSLFQKKRSDAGRAREYEKQEASLWERDKEMVFTSCATFSVKVLGEISVDEPRGVEVCEYAVKDIPYKKKKTRGQLKIYAHGLTFVEEKANALVINQTIEKVSFCCALPSNDRLFTYISRDGFTKQWVCHAFVTKKGISADRVSHACACAFTACLQRKQRERSKVGLPPLGAQTHAGTSDAPLGMRRVRSSGEVLELSSKEHNHFGTAPRLRPLGGSRGDLLEESMDIREAAAKQTSIKLLLESTDMNGQRIPTDILITSPRVNLLGSGFETNFTSPAKTNRRSLPGNPFDPIPQTVDPWAPAPSPTKKTQSDPFDPFPLFPSSQPPLPAATQLNPFSSLPAADPNLLSGATNPFV